MGEIGRRVTVCCLVLAVALTSAGCEFLGGVVSPGGSEASRQSIAVAVDSTATPSSVLPSGPDWVRDSAARTRPTVVQITNEQLQVNQFNQQVPAPAGTGSGFIFDATNGYIATNNHVIAGAQRLTVAVPDGRAFTAKLIGGDPETDLAVLQISAPNLPQAELGDSSKLQVGDGVVAIGNALALSGGSTVTAGVVSALDRAIQEGPTSSGAPGPYLYGLIQTDAPINPGNSGGPLTNSAGQVVGINTLVVVQAAEGVPAQGIGFAISINSARPVLDSLVRTGRVSHPYLGVQYVAVSPSIVAFLGLKADHGALVINVEGGSPAAKAGIQKGDVITAIDGQPIVGESSVGQAIASHKVGDTVRLTIVRGTSTFDVDVTLAEKPPSQ